MFKATTTGRSSSPAWSRRPSCLCAGGTISDRSGQFPLAIDEPCFDLALDYRFLSLSRADAIEKFGCPADQTWSLAADAAAKHGVDLHARVEAIIDRVEGYRKRIGCPPREAYWPHAIVSGISDVEAAELTGAADGLPGVFLLPSHRRTYPYGKLACHVIGITGEISKEDLAGRNAAIEQAVTDPNLADLAQYVPGDTIGKSGAERMCEGRLRGRRGLQRTARNDGQQVVVDEVQPQQGQDIKLTLDLQLQQFLTDQFADRNGAAAVVDVATGEILALVSVPTYDLNRYYTDYASLSTDQRDLPLLNRAVSRRYPPGSTAKLITALGALSEGVITASTTHNCQGSLFPGRPGFACNTRWGHGEIDLCTAIKVSCNVYFYMTGEALGGDRLSGWFARFGWAEPPGSGLPGESAGNVPTVDWVREHWKRDYYPADARFMAIGQSALEVTPLHVADAVATIARGAKLPLTLVMDGPPRQSDSLGLAAGDLQVVRRGMSRVVNEPGGTAYDVFHDAAVEPLGTSVAAKSGTAQAAPHRIDSNGNGRIDSQDEVVYSGDMAWVAGYAPIEQPRIAFAVVVEYPDEGGGSANAGPIAREMVRRAEQLGYFGGGQ